jgi:hypothetical protein
MAGVMHIWIAVQAIDFSQEVAAKAGAAQPKGK